ncbi:MAG: efflux RND transporter periplasmic adaptor subunit, partial [Burkholderiales bacterium]|nr:efflux RND transporter periplasmic adaptor subunit [Burkholderiales bacterium]
NLIFALAAIGLLGAGIGAGYWFGGHRAPSMASSMVPVAADAAGKKPLYYYDPMYPQQKFDKPGKSPFMDMMLVPVFGDDGGDTGSVKISSRVVQNLGIRTGEVTLGTLDKKVQVVGAVVFDERAVAVVQARVSGYIEKLFVRAPLDPIAKGQPLAEILAPEWVAAQEEYLALKKSPQANEALRQAARQRLILLGMAETTVAAIDADGKTRPRITLVAPIGGIVGELTARDGMAVMPGAMLFHINGLSTVWVNADVPETQVAWLKPGSTVEASVPAYPGEVFKGRVTALLPEVSATTRTLKARIEVANPQSRLVPGMFASIAVAASSKQEVLLVPSEAVIQTGKRSVVIAADTGQDGKQQFAPIDVEVGAEANGMTEIKSGLQKGMKVVLSGQFLIDSEASLKSSVTRMSDAPAMTSETHKGEGKVEKIGKDSVTLSHGPIESIKWGAMTMDFKLPKLGAPAGIVEGGNVKFEFTATKDGNFEITTIAPTENAVGVKK